MFHGDLCSAENLLTIVPGSEMISENWDPIALIDGNASSCLEFPFVNYATLHIKIYLQKEYRCHVTRGQDCMVKLQGLNSETDCIPGETSIISHAYEVCTSMSPVIDQYGVTCRYKCDISIGDSFLYLRIGIGPKQICAIEIP